MSTRFLVADASRPIRQLICRYLQAVGVAKPIEAADGKEAMGLFKPGGFDVVLTEINLPKSDGLQVIRAIREADAKVPILVMTTEADAAQIEQAKKAGATEYLLKPFDARARQMLLEYCKTTMPPSGKPPADA